MTPGAIQEVNSHMNKSLTCAQFDGATWRGRTPYLLCHFLFTGKSRHEFFNWLSLFRGAERPEEDITQYLFESFGIQKVSLLEEAAKVEKTLKDVVGRLWTEAHHGRRNGGSVEADVASTEQLIRNDSETYLGIVSLRQQEQVTELGYRYWWLTIDNMAWQIRNHLREEFRGKEPPSPLLSLDFLIENLSFGPERNRLTRSEEQELPAVLDIEMAPEEMSQDICRIADEVRKENEKLPEPVIRRKVRDAIDKARIGHSEVS